MQVLEFVCICSAYAMNVELCVPPAALILYNLNLVQKLQGSVLYMLNIVCNLQRSVHVELCVQPAALIL